MNNNSPTTFYLVRHGETKWNVEKIIQGHIDSPLTKKGVEGARTLAKELKKIKFDMFFSSDLLRAKKTAEIIALEHKLVVETTKALRERNFGHLEGKPRKKLEEWNHLTEKLTHEERISYKYSKDIESDGEITSRLLTFIRETAIANPGKKILVVTHGGIMRATLIKLGFGDYHSLTPGTVNNSGYIVIETDGTEINIRETKGISLINKN
ncbi:MAG: histidine phosphatase family protein [Patescibacteria group bacterium]